MGTDKGSWMPAAVSGLVVVGFFAMMALLLTGTIRPAGDVNTATMVGTAFGILCAAFIGVVNFWHGSSAGSRNKDDVLAKMATTPTAVPALLPPASSPLAADIGPNITDLIAKALGKAPAPVPTVPVPAAPAVRSPAAAVVSTKTLTGKMSTFGGPDDHGVAADEGLALVEPGDLPKFPGIFLPEQPAGTSGLARRLDPSSYYLACRWDYHETPRAFLQAHQVQVTNPANGKHEMARPADWGPNEKTGRVADLSPGLAAALGLKTDDQVSILIPLPSAAAASAGAPPETGVHVHAMAQSQEDLERVFGKFTYTEGKGGDINIDQAWITANIVSIDIPQLHKFTNNKPIECHRLVAGPLKAAFADIEAKGLLPLILAYDGLWVPRHKGHDPKRGISLHSWGAAIDINADWNPYGGKPAPLGAKGSTVALIPSFEAQGFAWGGYFSAPYQDSMHFELAKV